MFLLQFLVPYLHWSILCLYYLFTCSALLTLHCFFSRSSPCCLFSIDSTLCLLYWFFYSLDLSSFSLLSHISTSSSSLPVPFTTFPTLLYFLMSPNTILCFLCDVIPSSLLLRFTCPLSKSLPSIVYDAFRFLFFLTSLKHISLRPLLSTNYFTFLLFPSLTLLTSLVSQASLLCLPSLPSIADSLHIVSNTPREQWS